MQTTAYSIISCEKVSFEIVQKIIVNIVSPRCQTFLELSIENFMPAFLVRLLINFFNLFILSSIAEIGLNT